MRAIKVKYISQLNISSNTQTLLKMYEYSKEYAFLLNADMSIEVGSIIKNDAYDFYMVVTKVITEANSVLQLYTNLKRNGIRMITMILAPKTPLYNKKYYQGANMRYATDEDFNIDKQQNNMEKRNIKVTLEQAIEWYNSGNATLRTLALSAYAKDELELNYDAISKNVDTASVSMTTPMCEQDKFKVLTKLAIIAKHFNGNWVKTVCNTGYFIGNYNTQVGPVVDSCNGVGIYQHNTVQYAGIVYFKNQEDVIKAVKILGKRVKSLFD